MIFSLFSGSLSNKSLPVVRLNRLLWGSRAVVLGSYPPWSYSCSPGAFVIAVHCYCSCFLSGLDKVLWPCSQLTPEFGRTSTTALTSLVVRLNVELLFIKATVSLSLNDQVYHSMDLWIQLTSCSSLSVCGKNFLQILGSVKSFEPSLLILSHLNT